MAQDEYFLTFCRYVEANPLRARLVERADAWPWSGLSRRMQPASRRQGLRLDFMPFGTFCFSAAFTAPRLVHRQFIVWPFD